MNVAAPFIDSKLEGVIERTCDLLNRSEACLDNVDLKIDMIGYLKSTRGIKLRVSNVEQLTDEHIEEWCQICSRVGAWEPIIRLDPSIGSADINIEYKSVTGHCKSWLPRILYLAIIIVAWLKLGQPHPFREL